MNLGILIGFTLGFAVMFQAIGGGVKHFLDIPSFFIVIGGTFAAALVQFPFREILNIPNLIVLIVRSRSFQLSEAIILILNLRGIYRKKRRRGVESFIKTTDNDFLKLGLLLVIDKVPPDEIKEILKENVTLMKNRHESGIFLFEQLATYSPSFGLLGTLIGLVLLLSNLKTPSGIGPNMAIAIVTTFYGVLMANLIFLPVSGRLESMSKREVLYNQVLIEGLVGIAKGAPEYTLKERLMTYVPGTLKKTVDKKVTERMEG
jgi:chemotaxis protein MotA